MFVREKGVMNGSINKSYLKDLLCIGLVIVIYRCYR